MESGSVIQLASGIRHIPLPPFTSEPEFNLGQDQTENEIGASSTFPVIGGFIGSGQLAWRAAGPTVEIVGPGSGTRKAAWTFGAIMHNAGAKVTTVCGVGLGSISQVAVGVDLGGDRKAQGLVALLSLHSSRVTRVFHFTHKVTSLTMVSGGEVSIDPGTLAQELRPWHGIIAVGTAHGMLHLLDLGLDLGGHKVTSDELSPAALRNVVTPDPQAEINRVNYLRQRCHPIMCLSDGMSHGGRFQLIGPDDSVLFETSSAAVYISALTFIPQLASLIVGYNFGAFQIINLSTLTIDCTSPYEKNVPPVNSFACQEPENDPKNFIYLWLCRSWDSRDKLQEQLETKKKKCLPALCTMYAMNYDNKLWIEGHGLWYQGLASISPRFEFTAAGGIGLRGQPTFPSSVFAAMTVQQTSHNSAVTPGGSVGISALATPDEDSGPVPEQSLCFFGWAGGVVEKENVSLQHYLAVFDINQWYQAQMPSNLKLLEGHLCPYMSFHILDRVPGCNTNSDGSEVVLGASPKPASWSRHISRSCNENDWFPSSLSFDSFVLTSEGLMEYQCQSAQQFALNYMITCGPSAIVNPEEAYSMCVFSGLVPNEGPLIPGSSMMTEREALLTVAIDEQLVSFLMQCVAEFSEGRFTNLGCSLPSLLEWAWSRVCSIKATNDSLCLPLFEQDGGVISSSNISTLHQNLTSLSSLTAVISSIRDFAHTNMITLQSTGELENRVQVVELLMLHLSVVLWFYHCGLLSQNSAGEDVEECHHVPFPGDLLHRIYKNRRLEIKKLSATLRGNEILLIDGLLDDDVGGAGGHIKRTWKRDDEEGKSLKSLIDGTYPPPSLHALLDIFLLPSITTTTKHRIVQYLFLDLASLLSDGYVRVVEELVKYPSSFSLSPSLIKLTQAFWLIDHKDFQEGLNVLLDPLVSTRDITPRQHQRIVKAFLYQGEHNRALTYNQIRQPPRIEVDDIRLHLTLLLANSLIREAFHFQRQHRLKDNTLDLLNHFLTGCEQLGKLELVIHLPLSSIEEEALVAYLRSSSDSAALDYLMVYYLQRARYEDAALLQETLRCGSGLERKRQGARSALINAYLTHLPDVARRLTSSSVCKAGPYKAIYTKPQPLSAKIHQSRFSPKSRSGRLMDLQDEMRGPKKSTSEPFTPFRNKSQRRRAYETVGVSEEISLKRKSESLEMSHVVFPSRIGNLYSSYHEEDGDLTLFSQSAKRSRLGETSLLREDTRKLMESIMRKSIVSAPEEVPSSPQTISADLLSLLHTPKIVRKKKVSSANADSSLLIDTPQSILKVKQSIQRPMSPAASSENSLSFLSRMTASTKRINVSEEVLQSRVSDSSLTPKQLRFHLPKNQTDLNSTAPQTPVAANRSGKLESILTPLEEDEIENRESPKDLDSTRSDLDSTRSELDSTKSELSEEEEDEAAYKSTEVSAELPEDHSFLSVDMEDKFERSVEVQEEESSLDCFEEVRENSVKEGNGEAPEKHLEIGTPLLKLPEGDTPDDDEKAVDIRSENVIEISKEVQIQEVKVSKSQNQSMSSEQIEEYHITSFKKGSVLRNPFSGVPSPRQPLPGYSSKQGSEPVMSQEAPIVVEDPSDEEESQSRETTMNDTFYSVAEGEAEDEELTGAERSLEVEEGASDTSVSLYHFEGQDKDTTLLEEDGAEMLQAMVGGQENDMEGEDALTVFREVDSTTLFDQTQDMNKSEIFPSLVFSDSESDSEVEARKGQTQEEVKHMMGANDFTQDVINFKNQSEDKDSLIVAQSDDSLLKVSDEVKSMNKSEILPTLEFSDSESDGEGLEMKVTQEPSHTVDSLELEKAKERVLSILDENFPLESTIAEPAKSGAIHESVDGEIHQVIEREDEMTNEDVCEDEEVLELSLDTSEHFSPLRFSDESDDDEKETEEIGEADMSGIQEAPIARDEEILQQITRDEVNVAIAEGAEENSMEANMPEEHSVRVCDPDEEKRKEKEIVAENVHEEICDQDATAKNAPLIGSSVNELKVDGRKNNEGKEVIREIAICEKQQQISELDDKSADKMEVVVGETCSEHKETSTAQPSRMEIEDLGASVIDQVDSSKQEAASESLSEKIDNHSPSSNLTRRSTRSTPIKAKESNESVRVKSSHPPTPTRRSSRLSPIKAGTISEDEKIVSSPLRFSPLKAKTQTIHSVTEISKPDAHMESSGVSSGGVPNRLDVSIQDKEDVETIHCEGNVIDNKTLTEQNLESQVIEMATNSENTKMVAEQEITEMVTDSENVEIVTESERTEMVTDLEKTEMVTVSEEIVMVTDSEKTEIVTDSEKTEMVPETEKTEMVTDSDKTEIVTDSEKTEMVTDSEKTEIVTDSEKTEIVTDSEKTEMVPETEKTEMVTDSDKTEIVTDSEKTEIVTDSEKTEMVPEPEKTEMVTYSEKTEIVTDSEKTEIVTDSEETKTVTGSEKNDMATDLEKTETLTEPEKTEMVTEPEETEMATDSEKMEKVTVSEKTELVVVSENTEMVTDSQNTEMVTELEKTKMATDLEKTKMVTVSEKTEMVTVSEKTEMVTVSEKIEMVSVSENTEMVTDSEKTEIVTDLEKTEIVTDLEKTKMASDSEKTGMTTDLKITEITREFESSNEPDGQMSTDQVISPKVALSANEVGVVESSKSKGIVSESRRSVLEKTAEPNDYTPRRSRRLSSTSSPVAGLLMEDLDSVTPMRRSRRLSGINVGTPVTPRNRRRSGNLNPETPLQKSSLSGIVDTSEKPLQSDSKLDAVSTPITKASGSKAHASATTPSSRRRGRPRLDEVKKVTQKLLLSPERNVPIALSPSDREAAEALPTPPSSPSLGARKREPVNIDGAVLGPSNKKTPVRRSSRRRSISGTHEENIDELENDSKRKDASEVEDPSSTVGSSRKGVKDTPTNEPSHSLSAELTPIKHTTPSRSRKTPARVPQSLSLETISEDKELPSKVKPPGTPKHAVVKSEKVSSSRRKLRSSDNDDAPSTPEIKSATKRQRRSSVTSSLSSLKEVPLEPIAEDVFVEQRLRSAKKETSRLISQSEEEKTPSKRSTRSSMASPATTVKDSESSEEEQKISKKKVNRRRSLRVSNIPDISEVLGNRKRSRRTTLASSLYQTSNSSSQSVRSSTRSLSIYPEDDLSFLDSSPEPLKGKGRAAKKPPTSDDSVIEIDETKLYEDSEIHLSSGLDIKSKESASSAPESPEDPLNLIDEGRNSRRRSRLSRLSTVGVKKPVVTRRSIRSLSLSGNLQSEASEDDETEATMKVKQRHASSGAKKGLMIQSENRVRDIDESQKSGTDKETEKISEDMLAKQSTSDSEEERPIQFTFAEPKPVVASSRKSKEPMPNLKESAKKVKKGASKSQRKKR